MTDIPDLPDGGGVCIELTDIPGVDLAWLKSRATAIESAMGDRMDEMLEWQRVVANPENQGFDIYFRVSPDGESQGDLVPLALMEIVREVADPRSPA